MAGSEAFLLDVLLLGVSCFLHLVGVELEKVGDDFGFGRVGREHILSIPLIGELWHGRESDIISREV